MAADKAIIAASATYIRIESVASIFSLAFNFVMVGMLTLGKEKYVYVLTAVKLVLCLLLDTVYGFNASYFIKSWRKWYCFFKHNS